MTEYEVVYVEKKSPPSEFAEALKKALNQLSADGYHVVRLESDPYGTLVVANRMSDGVKKILQAIAAGATVVEEDDEEGTLSVEAEQLFNAVLRHINSTDHDFILDQLPKAVPIVCNKYPREQLVKIAEDIREYCLAHEQFHEDNNERVCSSGELLQAMLVQVDKVLQLSLC